MKYRVTIDDQEREIDVQLTAGGAVSVALDGEPLDADAVPIPGGVSLRLDGRVYDVVVGGKAEKLDVACGAHRTQAQVESERARARKKKRGAAGDTAKELRCPMPGRVLKILVKAGDEVAPGDPLVVVEAMKMENELRAEAGGKIASVEVNEGQNVESNAVLLRLE
ncbi:MAG: biotin/lipoyl-containing protein [Myxococcota bacterium]